MCPDCAGPALIGHPSIRQGRHDYPHLTQADSEAGRRRGRERTFLRGRARSPKAVIFLQLLGHPGPLRSRNKVNTYPALSETLKGRVSPHPEAWLGRPPHLHLNVGVGQVVLWRQLAVIVDEVVQDGGAQDGLRQRGENVREEAGVRILGVTATQVPHTERNISPISGQNKSETQAVSTSTVLVSEKR